MKLRQGLLAQSLLSAPLVAGFLLCAAPVMAQPVQGLYIAGEGGATFNQDQQVRRSANLPTGRDKWHAGGIGLGSIGYGLGNGFRVEVEGDYRSMAYKRFIADNVSGRADGRRQTAGVMANAFFDMDVGQPWIFPYFGAGVGYGWTKLNTSFTAPNSQLSQQTRGTFGNFAYQGIFGLAFPTPWVVGLSFTAEYRFWTMLGPQSHSTLAYGTVGGYSNQPKSAGWASGNRDTKTDFNHSLMLGLRYEFNPAPPPPPPPSETPAPAPQAARSYLVFFDWDKADLTDRARSIVSTAALASTHTTLTRITVSGYTDNSSAHPGQKSGLDYNKKLSFRRAEIVKAELVRDGVPGATIDIHGYGESNPLVHTGPNTKEAQNRRVEIIFR